MSVRLILLGAAVAIASAAHTAPARAYPIDCAILLCLAGGFPPSAECAAAKWEVFSKQEKLFVFF